MAERGRPPEVVEAPALVELVAPAGAGRLDAWLAGELPVSRSRLAALIKAGAVTVDGEAVKPRHRLLGGEAVRAELPPPPPSELRAQDLPLDILHEDEALLVVDKAAGMVVHPARGHPDGTLVNAVLGRLRGRWPDAPHRPGIVHRLDRGTSGVMVVARTPEAHAHLAAQFAERSVERRYVALVRGRMARPEGTVDAPLGRHPKDRVRFAVRPEGKEAVTHWRVLGEAALGAAGDPAGGVLSLLECRLETGRTHQIRVHLAHLGRPLLGDPLYGGRQRTPRALRELMAPVQDQLLHAWRLGFTHPRSGARLRFATEVPAHFAAVLAALELSDPAAGQPRVEVPG